MHSTHSMHSMTPHVYVEPASPSRLCANATNTFPLMCIQNVVYIQIYCLSCMGLTVKHDQPIGSYCLGQCGCILMLSMSIKYVHHE